MFYTWSGVPISYLQLLGQLCSSVILKVFTMMIRSPGGPGGLLIGGGHVKVLYVGVLKISPVGNVYNDDEDDVDDDDDGGNYDDCHYSLSGQEKP